MSALVANPAIRPVCVAPEGVPPRRPRHSLQAGQSAIGMELSGGGVAEEGLRARVELDLVLGKVLG